MRILRENTIPAKEITAISRVPPPMSMIMLPAGSWIGRPTPIAAASALHQIHCRGAACSAESRTARFSTSVMPEGIANSPSGTDETLAVWTLLMK